LDRFEAVISSDYGANLRKLRNQNSELSEEVRLKAVAEVDRLIEVLETELESRYSN
jgi:hypothetical protein